MMEIPEIIKALRINMVETGSLICVGCGREHNCSVHGCAIMREAANALETLNLRAATENKPLTLEQLRQMNNEKVWCEIPSDNPQYGIVIAKLECVSLKCGVLQFKYYGEWKAYAHKPEKEEKHYDDSYSR